MAERILLLRILKKEYKLHVKFSKFKRREGNILPLGLTPILVLIWQQYIAKAKVCYSYNYTVSHFNGQHYSTDALQSTQATMR